MENQIENKFSISNSSNFKENKNNIYFHSSIDDYNLEKKFINPKIEYSENQIMLNSPNINILNQDLISDKKRDTLMNDEKKRKNFNLELETEDENNIYFNNQEYIDPKSIKSFNCNF